LVLEFGTFFPDRPGLQAPPSDYKPDVRVVMNFNLVQGLIQGLQTAVAQQQQHQNVNQNIGKNPPGFKVPGT
jgi:hypothetical protein